jgi:hypothetical protein
MSKKMASVLIAYGVVLAGLGSLLHQSAPALGKVAFIAGLAGGGLSLLWGVAALAGLKGRVWATLSMIAVTVVLLSQAVSVWTHSTSEGASGLTIRLVVTAMFLLTMGMLLYLFHGERPPEFYEQRPSRPNGPASGRTEGKSRKIRSHR